MGNEVYPSGSGHFGIRTHTPCIPLYSCARAEMERPAQAPPRNFPRVSLCPPFSRESVIPRPIGVSGTPFEGRSIPSNVQVPQRFAMNLRLVASTNGHSGNSRGPSAGARLRAARTSLKIERALPGSEEARKKIIYYSLKRNNAEVLIARERL